MYRLELYDMHVSHTQLGIQKFHKTLTSGDSGSLEQRGDATGDATAAVVATTTTRPNSLVKFML